VAGIDLGFIDIALSAKFIHHSRDERHTDGLWNFIFCAHLAVKGSRRMKKSPEGWLIVRTAAQSSPFLSLKLPSRKHHLKI
jgi:hypothetical protein